MSKHYVEILERGTERERRGNEKGRHRSRSAHPSSFCGAGGSRTRVQTYAQYAFYMFISALIVGNRPGQNEPTVSLSAMVFIRCTQRAQAYPVIWLIGRRGLQQTAFPAAIMTTLISD